MKCISLVFLYVAILSIPLSATAYCFDFAGEKYKIDPLLLKAIAIQESGLNPKAINYNKSKSGKITSIDYGLTQVNSTHIPTLIRMGVINSKDDLLTNPCLNVQIGAWVLAKHIKICGVNWVCLGTYNAGFRNDTDKQKMKYARQVYIIYMSLLTKNRTT
ncbi:MULTISPECIES: lytic transglycosylase domain-containing protein [Rahnella]|uniref:lytic transglycosylase domain-containing protein n=1 Tax=Rahnella TaxID=34037 RepID=UPI003F6E1F58